MGYTASMDVIVRPSDGYVALQHRTSNPASVKIESNGHTYDFIPQHNVSLAWVDPQDVGPLLLVRARICCGKTDYKFRYATQINVNLWQTGDRHGT
jgi:hypothetical protein